MPATTFFTALVNAGIPPQEAQTLDTQYSHEAGFLDGLEVIAGWMALKQVPNAPVSIAQPWVDIYNDILTATQGGMDIDQAWSDALKTYTTDIQIALTKAISVRMKAILDFEQKKGNKKRFKGKDFIQQLKQLGYDFRYNEVTDMVEVNGSPITDAVAATIRMQLRDTGMVKTHEAEDAYLSYAWHNRYHPIKDYLKSLAWDGKANIETLSNFFVDEYGMFPVWLRKWLIGSCAKVFEAEQNPMLVLDAKQGTGKSEFAKWLAQPMFGYYIENAINPSDKDNGIRMARYWIWEVSELGTTMKKADYEALKAFLTTRKVTVRKPYDKFDMSKPALCSFIGTVNNSAGLYSDPTGSRRFLTSHILSIDWKGYTQAVAPEQVWAEAMAAYLMGEDWRITPDERKKATQINECYELDDINEDLIKKYFDIDPANLTWWTSTVDIVRVLEDPNQGNVHSPTRIITLSIANIMTRLGLKKGAKRNSIGQLIRGYYGIRLSLIPSP